MVKEQRSSQRYAPRDEILSQLIGQEGGGEKKRPLNISAGGAYLSNDGSPGAKVRVRFTGRDTATGSSFAVERHGTILRKGDVGGCSLQFEPPLTENELSCLSENGNGARSLMMMDYEQVNREARAVETCRSGIFLATLGALAAWTGVVAGSVLRRDGQTVDSVFWLISASLPYLVLTLAILVGIEKARAINMRRGFLAALTGLLRDGAAHPRYIGWAHLKPNRSNCGARVASGLCPNNKICWKEAVDHVPNLTGEKSTLEWPFVSFASFTTFVYLVLYVLTSVVLLFAVRDYLPGLMPKGYGWILFATGGLLVAGGVVLGWQLRELRKGKLSFEAFYLSWQKALEHCRRIDAKI